MILVPQSLSNMETQCLFFHRIILIIAMTPPECTWVHSSGKTGYFWTYHSLLTKYLPHDKGLGGKMSILTVAYPCLQCSTHSFLLLLTFLSSPLLHHCTPPFSLLGANSTPFRIPQPLRCILPVHLTSDADDFL